MARVAFWLVEVRVRGQLSNHTFPFCLKIIVKEQLILILDRPQETLEAVSKCIRSWE